MSTYYKNFDNKTAIITGGAGGLGAGIAKILAEQGANISLIDIDSEKLKVTSNEISCFGTKISLFQCDVTTFRAGAGFVCREEGKLELLSISHHAPAIELFEAP